MTSPIARRQPPEGAEGAHRHRHVPLGKGMHRARLAALQRAAEIEGHGVGGHLLVGLGGQGESGQLVVGEFLVGDGLAHRADATRPFRITAVGRDSRRPERVGSRRLRGARGRSPSPEGRSRGQHRDCGVGEPDAAAGEQDEWQAQERLVTQAVEGGAGRGAEHSGEGERGCGGRHHDMGQRGGCVCATEAPARAQRRSPRHGEEDEAGEAEVGGAHEQPHEPTTSDHGDHADGHLGDSEESHGQRADGSSERPKRMHRVARPQNLRGPADHEQDSGRVQRPAESVQESKSTGGP